MLRQRRMCGSFQMRSMGTSWGTPATAQGASVLVPVSLCSRHGHLAPRVEAPAARRHPQRGPAPGGFYRSRGHSPANGRVVACRVHRAPGTARRRAAPSAVLPARALPCDDAGRLGALPRHGETAWILAASRGSRSSTGRSVTRNGSSDPGAAVMLASAASGDCSQRRCHSDRTRSGARPCLRPSEREVPRRPWEPMTLPEQAST